MVTQITIRPPAPQPEPALQEAPRERNLSPYQRTMGKAPDMVNDEFFTSFADILDIFNPLQHVPVVSGLYREVAGDTVSPGARIFGGLLFGGPIGLFASVVNAIIEENTGGDISKNLFAAATSQYEKTSRLS